MVKKNTYQWDVAAEGVVESRVSRSQKKRDSTALQKLGEELATLSAGQLTSLPLTPDLLDAYAELARTRSKEGRRRQLQYIGRLMREADGVAIREALEAMRQGRTRENAVFHHAERMRDILLTGSDTDVLQMLAPWPDAVAALQELIHTARQEKKEGRSPRAARELFRRLHALLQA